MGPLSSLPLWLASPPPSFSSSLDPSCSHFSLSLSLSHPFQALILPNLGTPSLGTRKLSFLFFLPFLDPALFEFFSLFNCKGQGGAAFSLFFPSTCFGNPPYLLHPQSSPLSPSFVVSSFRFFFLASFGFFVFCSKEDTNTGWGTSIRKGP